MELCLAPLKRCPGTVYGTACNGNGACVRQPLSCTVLDDCAATCVCNDNWTGDACNIPAELITTLTQQQISVLEAVVRVCVLLQKRR